MSAGGLGQYPGEHRRSGRRSGQSSAVDRAKDGFRGAGDENLVVADGRWTSRGWSSRWLDMEGTVVRTASGDPFSPGWGGDC